ncbi:nucleotide disphospho-sugar-binding domain-containing protein [Hyalangium versicolor]|uniref:nucleotide disphospho-sugar-binding domain-containing protein n=1 Tax=Hyalangium versicolor TaxID=2861190 RepID=UPI001CC929A0|nr:nucleotide disphospho-sugar-binding domain-containing protein [Hyalangium versicolor]
MRVLFCSSPLLGYFLPLVPWAWALRAAGHTVRVATTGEGLEACGHAGLHAFDAAPGVNVDEVFRSTIAANRAAMPVGTPPPWAGAGKSSPFSNKPATPPGPGSASPWGQAGRTSPFAKVADLMTDETIRIARDFRPTLVIYPRLHVLGRLAAEVLGVPVVAHSPSLPMAPEMMGPLSWLIPPEACERHGRTIELASPAALLHPTPPSMLNDDFPPGWPTRYVPYNGSNGALPSWLLERPTRPRICVTLGSVIPGMGGVSAVKNVVDVLAERDVEVVLALGGADLQSLGTLPANARATGWVPLSELLPSCSAIVHHGGAGTTWTALALGIPQLILPQGADQPFNAAAAEKRGVAVVFSPVPETRAPLEEALDRVLKNGEMRAAARAVQEEMAKLPGPHEMIEKLAALT